MHESVIWLKLHESLSLIIMFMLACVASLLRTEKHSLISVITGIIFSGFIAYSVNLLLTDITIVNISENIRVVAVGISAYLNRYIMDILDKLAVQISSDPIKTLSDIRKIWKK
ncbi:hypothetical protein [Photobacterium piscicola]|jgi:hypothetical protein|uniref:hypothetical protein n=1 Tax=Photobacterium piscicola TaxID=1378299 RepID=UPI003736B359